jgi:hypothetical protein
VVIATLHVSSAVNVVRVRCSGVQVRLIKEVLGYVEPARLSSDTVGLAEKGISND